MERHVDWKNLINVNHEILTKSINAEFFFLKKNLENSNRDIETSTGLGG